MTQPKRKHVTVARAKTAKVMTDIRDAEDTLHEANEVLSKAQVDKNEVNTVLEQNVAVEAQLHDAVNELKVVTDLLKSAEADKAKDGAQQVPGNRSGEGIDSVIEHLNVRPRPDSHAP